MSHLCYYLLFQSINEIIVEVPGSLLEQPLKYICQFYLKTLGEGNFYYHGGRDLSCNGLCSATVIQSSGNQHACGTQDGGDSISMPTWK